MIYKMRSLILIVPVSHRVVMRIKWQRFYEKKLSLSKMMTSKYNIKLWTLSCTRWKHIIKKVSGTNEKAVIQKWKTTFPEFDNNVISGKNVLALKIHT